MKNTISVIIATRNRSDKLYSCISSILDNNYQKLEIIVTDQSKYYIINKALLNNLIKNHKIRSFHIKLVSDGKSKAINQVLSITKRNLLVFTDDDCVVNKNWLINIEKTFKENSDVDGVFGKVLPYKPESHKGKNCPSVFLYEKKHIIQKPTPHWKAIGFGNNMVIRKELFQNIGSFKEWLGPGSIGKAAMDGEFALRALVKGYKLLYNPDVVVYHNRWLTKEEFRKQNLSYSCGQIACYGYFAIQGHEFGKKVLVYDFLDSANKLKRDVKALLFLKRKSFQYLLQTIEELLYRIRGFFVALYYSKTDPIK